MIVMIENDWRLHIALSINDCEENVKARCLASIDTRIILVFSFYILMNYYRSSRFPTFSSNEVQH